MSNFVKFSLFILLLQIFLVRSQESNVSTSKEQDNDQISSKCEAIKFFHCQDIKFYNQTIFPNLLNHTDQDEAALEMHQYIPLIKINCSLDLQLFLCSLYFPQCSTLNLPIPPCRKLCESSRSCENIMRTFGFSWPRILECSNFPEDGTEICNSYNI